MCLPVVLKRSNIEQPSRRQFIGPDKAFNAGRWTLSCVWVERTLGLAAARSWIKSSGGRIFARKWPSAGD